MLEALIDRGYWFLSAAALSGHLQWWGKTIAAKSALVFIRRLSGGNQLVRVYWNLINNWCSLMGRTAGEFVLVLPAGQSGWLKMWNNSSSTPKCFLSIIYMIVVCKVSHNVYLCWAKRYNATCAANFLWNTHHEKLGTLLGEPYMIPVIKM